MKNRPARNFWTGTVAVGIFISLATLSTYADERPSVQSLSEAAGRQLKSNDFAAAEETYERIVLLQPKLAEAQANLGLVLYLQNKYQKATGALTEAVALNPRLVRPRVLLALCLFGEGYYDKSATLLAELMRIDSRDPVIAQHLALALFRLDRLPEAIPVFRRWLELEPNSQDALYFLGQSYMLSAKQTFRRLELNAPESARMHQLRAEMLQQQGSAEPAIAEYRKAIQTNSQMPGLHYMLGELFWAAMRLDEAEKEFALELRISPSDADTLARAGDTALKQQKLETAESYLKRALDRNAKDVNSHLNLGQVYRLNGRFSLAEAEFASALGLDPTRAETHYALAELFRASGRATDAQRELRKFAELKRSSQNGAGGMPEARN